MISIDTEGNSLRAHEPGVSFLCQWAGADYEECESGRDVPAFRAVLERESELWFANASYDVHCIRSTWGIDLLRSGHKVRDVQTLARIVVPGRFDYRLESLADKYLGTDSTVQQRELKELAKTLGIGTLKQEGAHRAIWDAYPHKLEAYGMEDVRITYDLVGKLMQYASPSDLRVFDMECEVQRVLMTAEQYGVMVDKTELALLRTRLEAALADAHAKLLDWLPAEALGSDDSPASQSALREGLLAAGVPLYAHTPSSGKVDPKTGKKRPIVFATNKDALSEFKTSNEVIGLLFEWRRLGKVLSTYVAALERANPRVHASFLSCEARTSRMSCRSPNLQNLPRGSGARNAIIPEKGNALVVCDYDSIEVWILAHYLSRQLNDQRLMDKLKAGLDQHRDSAAYLHSRGFIPPAPGAPARNAPMEELKAYYSKGAAGDKARSAAKNSATFPAIYGAGDASISRGLGLPVGTKGVKNAVLEALPGYFCVPTDGTEILTRRGWLKHDEVGVGDETLGYAPDGIMQWTAVSAVHHPGIQDVVPYGHSRWSMRCTTEHRWLADRPAIGGRCALAPRMVAFDALDTADRLVLGAPAAGGALDVSPDEAAAIAWVLCDGSLRRGGSDACVYQAKEPFRSDIRRLLGRMGALAYESVREPCHPARLPCSTFGLRAEWTRDVWRRAGLEAGRRPDMTAFVLGLPADARAALVQAALDAEGHVSAKGVQSWAQNEGPLLDGFVLAFHLEGYKVSHHRNVAGCTTITLGPPRCTMQSKEARTGAPVATEVWCVTTGLGTWLMRQDGHIMLTGNCLYDAVMKHARRVGFLRTVTGRRLDTPRGKNHILVNSIIQGSAAEAMKLGMLAAEAPLRELGYQIVLVVHDELVSEGPVKNAPLALEAQREAMESVGMALDHEGRRIFDCPLKATGSYTTKSYGDTK